MAIPSQDQMRKMHTTAERRNLSMTSISVSGVRGARYHQCKECTVEAESQTGYLSHKHEEIKRQGNEYAK